MYSASLSQQEELHHSQNVCLFKSVPFTCAGTQISSVVVFVSLYGRSNLEYSVYWLLIVNAVYAVRLLDSKLFFKDARASFRSRSWKIRFAIGSFCGALAWATSIWFLFPNHDIHYAAFLVIAISAVGAGSLASTPYRPGLLFLFLSILGLGLTLKLFLVGDTFAFVLAIYSLTIFCFLLSSGFRISANFNELLRMKLDSQNTSLNMMSVTEDMAKMGYWSWPVDAEKIDLSDSFCRLLKIEQRQISIEEIQECIHAEDKSRVLLSMESFRQGKKIDEEVLEFKLDPNKYGCERYIRQFTKPIKNTDGTTVLFGSVQDITQFRNDEQKIYAMAYFDTLTDLANRAHFLERLDDQVAKASIDNTCFALLYMDIDNFKEVNDAYGHKCGDAYLKSLASYLSETLEPDHLVARLGGDEFCILLRDVQSYESVLDITSGFNEYKQQKLQLGPYSIRPQFSVGVTLYPEHAENPDDLVKHADLAMYNAKQLVDSDIALYKESMSAEVSKRLQIETDIREGLVNDEFELWYQPKVDVISKALIGFEALIRWRKDGKIIPPDSFIPVAETVGLINDIGEWVLETASDQMIVWNKLGHKINIAVNISSNHFSSDSFLPKIKNLLEEKDIDPEDLEIEITESLSRDPDVQSRICAQLKTLGVCIAIDDFGTGYSSLSVLADLHADTLKIDQSFIRKLPGCTESGMLVKTIIDLAKGLDFSIVAEGVETAEQFQYLEVLGCHFAQGYYCSKPVPMEEATNLLNTGLPNLCSPSQYIPLDSKSKAA